MEVTLGNRADAVNHYKKYEQKWKKCLKALKKKNNMIYRITNNSSSCTELKKTKKIRAKDFKKRSYYRRKSSRSGSDYGSYLSSDID